MWQRPEGHQRSGTGAATSVKSDGADSRRFVAVSQGCNCRIGAAEGARGVLVECERPEIRIHGAIEKEAPHKGFSLLQDEFEGLCSLDQANLSRDHAQDADLTSGGHKVLLRWMRQHATQAWTATFRVEDACLPFRSHCRAKNIGLTLKKGGIIQEVLRLEIVRSVNDDIEVPHDGNSVCPGKAVRESEDLYIRVDARYTLFCRLRLRFSDAVEGVNNLAIEIARIDLIKVNNSDRAHP